MIHNFLDPVFIIKTLGIIGVFLIVFAESGLFFGFFLPGDSLLFTAGLLASQGYFSISLLIIGSVVCAILGDSVGYAFGKKVGPKIFTKDDSLFFHRDHIAKAQHFYEKHGKKTIILARFIPIVRTFAPIVAGVGNMRYRTFLSYNIIGGIIWAVLLPLLGYILGSTVPHVDRYLLPIILLIIFISFIPVFIEFFKHKK
jgi:membrane-associated protein